MRRRNAEEDGGGCTVVDTVNASLDVGGSSTGESIDSTANDAHHADAAGAGRYRALGGTIDRRARRRRSTRTRKRQRCDACHDCPKEAVGSMAVFFGTLLLVSIYQNHWNGGKGATSVTSTTTTSLNDGSSSTRLRRRKRPRPRNHQDNATSSLFSYYDDNNPHSFRVDTPHAPSCSASLDPESIAYTLVTQLSAERMWMLGRHCERWGRDYPVSAAVFTNRSVAEMTRDLVGNSTGSGSGCTRRQLSLSVLNSDEYDDADYPVNTLRNMALAQVRTSHVMYVDIDFWPSTTLRPILESTPLRREFATDPKLAVVVPAYQLYAHRLCGETENCKEKEQTNEVPKTMTDLRSLLKTEDVGIFDLESNWNGHGSTSYKTFLLQNDGELFDLPCVNSNRYEPYLAFRYCADLPPFQEAFTGYGKNKMTWAMHLRRSGYDFAQMGGSFVCHYPHFRSKAKLSWDYIPNLNVTDVLAVSVEARKAAKQNRFNVIEKKDMIRDVDWSQTKRGKGDLLYLHYRKWLYDTVPDEARLKMCDETYTDDNKLWVN